MTIVRIIKDWSWPDLFRQTPQRNGIWRGIKFTIDKVRESDYVIVLNKPSQDTWVKCDPIHIWAIMQEPPNELYKLMHRGDKSYSRIYTSDSNLDGDKYILSQPSLPWHVNKDYDFLINCGIPEKVKDISWITGNIDVSLGHRERLKFINRIQTKLEFDLFGRGFNYIEDKWDGLSGYKYSLAVENFCNDYYWSEKIADCFLAWTMPIYYGCKLINEFFPPEAMISIDIHDPHTIEKVRKAVSTNAWHRNLDAIDYARQLVLNNYQLFPFVVQEIQSHEQQDNVESHESQVIVLHSTLQIPLSIGEKMHEFVRRYVPLYIRRTVSKIRRLSRE